MWFKWRTYKSLNMKLDKRWCLIFGVVLPYFLSKTIVFRRDELPLCQDVMVVPNYLKMMSRSRFMCIYTPLGKFWSQPVQEERNIVMRRLQAHRITSVVTLYATGRVQVRPKLNRTVGRRVLISSEVKHVYYFGVQQTHCLKQSTDRSLYCTPSHFFWVFSWVTGHSNISKDDPTNSEDYPYRTRLL